VRHGEILHPGRFEHAGRAGEKSLGVIERDRPKEGLRIEPGPAVEEIVEVRCLEPGMTRDGFDRRSFPSL
jgi:hypothetical protein